MKINKKISAVLMIFSFYFLNIKTMEEPYKIEDKEPAQDLLYIQNNMPTSFWLSIKYGGKFEQTSMGSSSIKDTQKREVLYQGEIKAHDKISFDKKRFDNLTIRIFETEQDLKKYINSIKAIILTPVDLAGLRQFDLILAIKESYNFIGFSCPICLENIKVNQSVGIIDPCGHKFHLECINKWIKTKYTCPICKAENIKIVEKPATLQKYI